MWAHVHGRIEEEAVTYTALVELTMRPETVLYVHYSTQSYTAEADKDYISTNGTLMWSIGENQRKKVNVSILDDQV